MKCCCFCGEEIKDSPSYILIIQKDVNYQDSELPTQELYVHESCFEKNLFQSNWLYLKYL